MDFLALVASQGGTPPPAQSEATQVNTYFFLGDSIMEGQDLVSRTSDVSTTSVQTKHRIYQNGAYSFANYEAGVTGSADANEFGPVCRTGYDAGEYWVGKSGYDASYVYSVEHAVGGSTLAVDWIAGTTEVTDGPELSSWKSYVRQAKQTADSLNESIIPKGICISLGANDGTTQAHADAFQVNMQDLINNLKSFIQSEFGISNVPIVWLRPYGALDASQVYNSTVRAACDTVIDNYTTYSDVYLSNMDNIPLKTDNVHPTADGTITLGTDFFNRLSPVPTSRVEFVDTATVSAVLIDLHGTSDNREANISHSLQIKEGAVNVGSPIVLVGNRSDYSIDLTAYLVDYSAWPNTAWSIEVTPTNTVTSDAGSATEFIGGTADVTNAIYGMTGPGADAVNPANVPTANVYRIRAGVNGVTLKDSFNYFRAVTDDNAIGIIEEDGFIETNLSYWSEGNKLLWDQSPNGCIFRNIGFHGTTTKTKSSNIFLINITIYSDDGRLSGDALTTTYQGSSGAYVYDVPGDGTFLYRCDLWGSSDEVLDIGHAHPLYRIIESRICCGMGGGSQYGSLMDPQEHFTQTGEDTETEVIIQRCLFYRNRQRNPLSRVEKMLILDSVILDPGTKMVELDVRTSTFNPNPRACKTDVINCKVGIGPSYTRSNYLTAAEKLIHLSSATDPNGNEVYESGNKVYLQDGTLIASSPDDIISNSGDSHFTVVGTAQTWHNGVTITDTNYLTLIDELGTYARFKKTYPRDQWDANSGGLVTSWSGVGGFPTTGSSTASYDLTDWNTVQANGATKLYNEIFGVTP